MIRVLMVCLGNICRSPTAEVVFRQAVAAHHLENEISIDSCGTGDWHIGHSPDSRATQAAAKRDFDLSPLRARQLSSIDFQEFDYIFAMDKENYRNLIRKCSQEYQHKISLFLQTNQDYQEVPDPYYSGEDGFELVLDLVEVASESIIKNMIIAHGLKEA